MSWMKKRTPNIRDLNKTELILCYLSSEADSSLQTWIFQTQEAFLLVPLSDCLHEFYFRGTNWLSGSNFGERIKIQKRKKLCIIYLLKVFLRAVTQHFHISLSGKNIIPHFHHWLYFLFNSLINICHPMQDLEYWQ